MTDMTESNSDAEYIGDLLTELLNEKAEDDSSKLPILRGLFSRLTFRDLSDILLVGSAELLTRQREKERREQQEFMLERYERVWRPILNSGTGIQIPGCSDEMMSNVLQIFRDIEERTGDQFAVSVHPGRHGTVDVLIGKLESK